MGRGADLLAGAGRAALAVAGALALAGCVATTPSPTPYKPAGGTDGGGYSGQALAEDRVRVTFAGNSNTPRETVETYLLYRAAEVTLHQGHDHFVVVETDTERFTRRRPVGPRFSLGIGYGSGYRCCDDGPHTLFRYRYGFPFHGPFHDPFYGPFGYPGAYPQAVATERRYTAHAVIAMRDGPAPADMAEAYDARSVAETLGPQVVRPGRPAPGGPAAGPALSPTPLPGRKPAPPGGSAS